MLSLTKTSFLLLMTAAIATTPYSQLLRASATHLNIRQEGKENNNFNGTKSQISLANSLQNNYCFFLLTCNPITQLPIHIETLPYPAQNLQIQISKPLTQREANSLITQVIQAINAQNSNFFLPYLMTRDQNIDNVQAALNHYQSYFQGQKITKFKLIKSEKLGEIKPNFAIQRFTYKLSSASGISTEMVIYQDQNIRLIDPFLLYSLYSDRLIQGYINAIQSQNIQQISQIISPEESIFTEQELMAVLSKYRNLLGLNILSYQLTGLHQQHKYFTYTISGNNRKQHQIKILYADGLISVQDNFLPVKN